VKRKIIPLFMPNQGCQGRCIYCDQGITMGDAPLIPEAEQLERQILDCCSSPGPDAGRRHVEAAFFGGTFTALPVARQEGLLGALKGLRAQGILNGLRISTHPSHLDRQTVTRLQRAGVTVVELGVQSFDDLVLDRAGRRYSGQEAEDACRRVAKAGLELVIQLMPFLPGSSSVSDLNSARRTAQLRPDGVRIFPTVVLEGTELARMWRDREYEAVELAEAIDRVALMLELVAPHCEVLRIGLQESETTSAAVLAGPHHPALGEHCWRGLLVRVLVALVTHIGLGQEEVAIVVRPQVASLLHGHSKAGLRALEEQLPPGSFKLLRHKEHREPEGQPEVWWKCDKLAVTHYNGVVVVEAGRDER